MINLDEQYVKEIKELKTEVKRVTEEIYAKLVMIVEESKEMSNKELASIIENSIVKRYVFMLKNGKEFDKKKLYLLDPKLF